MAFRRRKAPGPGLPPGDQGRQPRCPRCGGPLARYGTGGRVEVSGGLALFTCYRHGIQTLDLGKATPADRKMLRLEET